MTNLTAVDIGETIIAFKWITIKDVDNTRTVVNYFVKGQEMTSVVFLGPASTTVTLTGLLQFMTYNVSITLENTLGQLSNSTSVEVMTLSLGKYCGTLIK